MPAITIECIDCGNNFIFSEDEQATLQAKAVERNWERCDAPRRCKSCRKVNRELRSKPDQFGFDVTNDQDAHRAWQEGYITIYSGTTVIAEANEVEFVDRIAELLRQGKVVRAIRQIRAARQEVANRIW